MRNLISGAVVCLSASAVWAGNGDIGSVNIQERLPGLANGKWKAVSQGAVQAGTTFEDSLMSLTVKDNTLLITNPKSNDCEESYTVRYDSSFIMSDRESKKSPWVGRGCGLVKQHPNSNLAQFAFCQSEANSYEMILGEGMPITLAKFYRSSNQGALLREYSQIRKTGGPQSSVGGNDEELIKVDLAHAEKILKGGNSTLKQETLNNLSHNLWTGKPETVKQRMRLIEMGMKDSDETVQEKALQSFYLGGRVLSAVAPLKEWMKTFSSKSPALQAAGVQALSSILYQSLRTVEPSEKMIAKYGVSHPKEILKAAGGTIEAADEKDFLELCRSRNRKTDTHFSKQDYEEIRGILAEAAKASSGQVSLDARRALKENMLSTQASVVNKASSSSGVK